MVYPHYMSVALPRQRREVSSNALSACRNIFFPATGRTKCQRARKRLEILRISWMEAGAFRAADADKSRTVFT